MKYLRPVLLHVGVIGIWGAVCLVLGLRGWWVQPVAPAGNTQVFADWAATRLAQDNPGSYAMSLVADGELYRYEFGGARAVDADTLFPTASFSKWITALTVLSLAREDRIDLDAPVEDTLTRWQLPASDFDNLGVTPRRLLSHTAGLTDGLGYGDYLPEESLPGLVAELENPRASDGSADIRLGIEPGSEFRYSGGGYLVLELLVEEVTGKPFAEVVRERILEPLNMQRSTYTPLDEDTNASPIFRADGTTAPRYRYASSAATGFASTAADLTRLAIAILEPPADSPVHEKTLRKMRQPEASAYGAPIWGLGTMLYAPAGDGDYVFGHDGRNDPAISAAVRLSPHTRDAIVVLASGVPGLATHIAAEWTLWQTGSPDVFSVERAISSAFLPWLIGSVVIVLLFWIWRSRR